jgi:MarR family transcriptional regulator, lower aerobic nicotinate degradation pathway regulator
MSLRAAYLAMHRCTGAALARTGVTADQFVVLAALSEADALTQRELVSRTSSDPNTIRAMLVLLERQDLIKRRPHPTDGRARSVCLTRKGRSAFRSLWRESEPLRTALMKALAPADAAVLVRQLRRIAESLEPERVVHPKTRTRMPARLAT